MSTSVSADVLYYTVCEIKESHVLLNQNSMCYSITFEMIYV